jgi:hypothetical protein
MAKGGHGLPKVLLERAMPYSSSPCGRPPQKRPYNSLRGGRPQGGRPAVIFYSLGQPTARRRTPLVSVGVASILLHPIFPSHFGFHERQFVSVMNQGGERKQTFPWRGASVVLRHSEVEGLRESWADGAQESQGLNSLLTLPQMQVFAYVCIRNYLSFH